MHFYLPLNEDGTVNYNPCGYEQYWEKMLQKETSSGTAGRTDGGMGWNNNIIAMLAVPGDSHGTVCISQ